MNTDLNTEVRFERLTAQNSAEVADLLNATWPSLYGETGCPRFTEEYLQWLYGGPYHDRNLIVGVRSEGSLVALKASLCRRVSDGKSTWMAHIATHLTIDPGLDLGARVALASAMSDYHTLDPENDRNFGISGDFSIAFFEKAKALSRSTKRIAEARQLQVNEVGFRQAIVNPRKARKLAESATGITTRFAEKADMPAVDELIRATPTGLHLAASPDWLWHHFSKAPGAKCWIAEEGGETVGVISIYTLDWVKGEQTSHNVIAELVLGRKPEQIAVLLSEALDIAEIAGVRGIVLDNTTYLDEEVARQTGILPLPKEMTFAVRSPQQAPEIAEGFLIDVK